MPDKKRLLIITSSYPHDTTDGRAAAGFFVKDFINKISGLSDVTVLTQHTGEGPYHIKEKQYSVIRFPWRGKSRPLSTLRFPQDIFLILSVMSAGIFASIQQIRKKEIDHVIAMWAIPCGIWALVLKKIYKIPYTVWCLGADVWNYQNSRLSKVILRLVLKNADKVYADGFELRDTIKNITQVDCSYLPSSRYFTPPNNHYILKPTGVRHYLFVGRYHPNKGPDILIEAINLLPDNIRSNIHCHIYGGGPLLNELKSLIQQFQLEDFITLGDFIGETRLTEIVNAADVIVVPSRKDTISLMISAALQMNKSIIATDVGDMGYILKKYNAGSVVPDESAELLAHAIQRDLLEPDVFSAERADLIELLDISKSVADMLESITRTR